MHAVYPGTFDPITLGHMDIITRGLRLFQPLTVAVAGNHGKKPLFSLAERVRMVEEACQAAQADVRVVPFEQLLIAFVQEQRAGVVLRGLRAVSDFEEEFQMASMNYRLDNSIETVFMMAEEGQHFVSSRFVREIARMGGDVGQFVPPHVHAALKERNA
ncbi:MAG: pantetheine-phosphate adenylyltransferase [Alphaproteobacteria bacterium]|nr:pantetheine-phosphate adenylyltransferase [Alphaproteobacteria bacterium]